jgi:ABC-type uncharacterized transport system ATPase subunit
MEPVLELRGITKRFPGVLANDHIDLTLNKGEIHALLGENGAGKSTLMNILYGLYEPDEGEVYVKGEKLEVDSPSDAISAGIGMVHQHFMLVPVFTVTENVMLGEEEVWLLSFLKNIVEKAPWTRFIFGPIKSENPFLKWLYHWMVSPLRAIGLLAAVFSIIINGMVLAGLEGDPMMTVNGLLAALFVLVVDYCLVVLLFGALYRRKAASRISELSEQYRLAVNPNSLVGDLPVGVQQRVEIIKLLYREADILILDEPTAVLTPQEVDELFAIMRSLVDQGKSIIFITHKLREVLEFADRITVIRRGAVVGSTTPAEADQAMLATMMVGRDVDLEVDKTPATPGEVVLKVENLEVLDQRNQLAVQGVSFEVRSGEILGIAGVQGNGQTELVKALTGLADVAEGQITFEGEAIVDQEVKFSWKNLLNLIKEFVVKFFLGLGRIIASIGLGIVLLVAISVLFAVLLAIVCLVLAIEIILILVGIPFIVLGWAIKPLRAISDFFRKAINVVWRTFSQVLNYVIDYSLGWLLNLVYKILNPLTLPRKVTEIGTAHIPEDRQADGLVLPFPISDNLILNTYYLPPFSRGLVLQERSIHESAVELVDQFDVRTPSAVTSVGSLSGGNQQKVIVAREFSRPVKLLIASQPTRGLDVGSIEYIHSQVIKKRDEGVGVLLVSTELDEVLQLSDRIAVMYRGKIIAMLPAEGATKEEIGLLMAGVTPEKTG